VLHELTYTPLRVLAVELREGRISPTELVESCLQRIDAVDGRLGAFCALDADGARAAARDAERDIGKGSYRGPLHGIPVAIKDLIFTKGLRTAGGSSIYQDFVPDEDDVVVERLRAAGAIVLGKTNVPEFGFGITTRNDTFGVTRNPWDPSRTPGGSSGGSAAAVAAGMCPIAIGSDGGGSIRVPSSFSGIFGLKPTFGLVPLYPGCRDPRYPGFSAWETLEHIGPMTRDVTDAALVLEVLAGADPRDRHSLPSLGPYSTSLERTSWQGTRVGWTCDFGTGVPVERGVRDGLERVLEVLGEAGASIEQTTLRLDGSLETFGAVVALDADIASMRDLIERHPGAVNERIVSLMGQERSGLELSTAVAQRKALYESVRAYFVDYDLLLTPTTPIPAFDADRAAPESIDGVPVSDPRDVLCFTYPFNLTGHPAASVPAGWSGGLPVGVQVVGDRLADELVLQASYEIERQLPWADRKPEPSE
jgi:aspartyl-tRNA(Asn)/glutamyl-tRNA(Gln) amidotransferase subunit A